MTFKKDMAQLGEQAVMASRALARLSTRKKNAALEAMANELETREAEILEAHAKDLEAGKKTGLSAAMLDRLELTPSRYEGMVKGIRDVASLIDPVGNVLSSWIRPNGLEIRKVRVPIGVIAIIYESRPNVTADAAALCIKTSNAVILRGGKEAVHTNRAIVAILQEGGENKGLPPCSVQLVQTTDRKAAEALLKLDELIDMVIPRGGEGLIRAVAEASTIPVIKHYKGICHTYVDSSADMEMAQSICENAKLQRPGVCNAMETLLVNQDVARNFLPPFLKRLHEQGVEIRGDETVCKIDPKATKASKDDWSEEYLDLILSVKTVVDVHDAIDHINKYGSGHSDAVVAQSSAVQKAFLQEVDSATVYVNASTRFTDGAEFGMGAEIGISTDKLHARGPMGLEELTTYKYLILGKGQIKT